LIDKYDIESQTKSLITYVTSEKWVNTVTEGTDEEVKKGLGEAIDPLSRKVLKTPGAGIAE